MQTCDSDSEDLLGWGSSQPLVFLPEQPFLRDNIKCQQSSALLSSIVSNAMSLCRKRWTLYNNAWQIWWQLWTFLHNIFASFSCYLVKTISCPLEEDVKSWQSKPYPLRLTLLSNSVASQLPFLAGWPFCTSFSCQWPPSPSSKFVAFFGKSNSRNY